ncbi:DUF3298 domain-containing protein [Pasteurellaceae bacterium 22721_9_1]
MRTSILSFAILSALVLTGCNDKETQAKLLQAEREVVQLKADLEKSQAELQAAQDKLNKISSEIPTLNVKPITIFSAKEEFKRTQPKDDEYGYTESYINYHVETVETGYEWLDNLLYQQLIGKLDENLAESPEVLKKIKALPTNKDRFKALMQFYYEGDLQSSKNFESLGNEYEFFLTYIGQRQNVISFAQYTSTYSGGAHGMNWSNYYHIDTETKSIIKLEDLFATKNHPALKKFLWESYKDYQYRLDNKIKENEFYTPESELYISPDFYFDAEGINFVYPPYAIGPYAEGEIILKVYWGQVKDIINPKYRW